MITKALKALYKKLTGQATKSVTKGQILMEIARDFPEISGVLPTVSEADNGKALLVINGAWGKSVIAVLPTVTSADNGKILKVAEGAWALGNETVELPVPTVEDAGKVLAVKEDGSGYELISIEP